MFCLPKGQLNISVNKSGMCLDVCAHTVLYAAYINGYNCMF